MHATDATRQFWSQGSPSSGTGCLAVDRRSDSSLTGARAGVLVSPSSPPRRGEGIRPGFDRLVHCQVRTKEPKLGLLVVWIDFSPMLRPVRIKSRSLVFFTKKLKFACQLKLGAELDPPRLHVLGCARDILFLRCGSIFVLCSI